MNTDVEYKLLITNIKKYRAKAGFTQEQLAEEADLSVSYIKQLESGKNFKNVSFTTIVRLSRGLNIEISNLLE